MNVFFHCASCSSVGPHIGRYCGQTSPGRVISYTGILSMTITTDTAITKEGFSANYTIRDTGLPQGNTQQGDLSSQYGVKTALSFQSQAWQPHTKG